MIETELGNAGPLLSLNRIENRYKKAVKRHVDKRR